MDSNWQRMKPEESLDWWEFNQRWESRAKMWYNPIDFLDYSNQKTFSDDCDHKCRYFIMIYYALINLGTGEQGPVNTEEMMWFSASLLISNLVFSIFFSNITSLLLELSIEELMHQRKIDDANELMISIDLTDCCQDDIRMFFKKHEHSEQFMNEFDEMMGRVPHTCRMKLTKVLYSQILLANPVISNSMINMFNNSSDLLLKLNLAYRWKFVKN